MIQERSAKMLNEPQSTPIVAPIPTPRPKFDSLQGCDVAKVALYGLPNNLNFDTIDFEQCILECINNKLDERKPDTGLSKRMITEIPIHSIDCSQCSINGHDSDVHCQKHPIHKYSVAIHKNKLLWALLLEKEEKVELKENESKQIAIGKKKQEEEEERKENEAKHVDIGKKKEEPKINRNWKILTKIKQNPCGYFQHCFDDIKLCYVNYQQLPNMIIWLIMSMPKRIVKNPTTLLRPQPVKIICDDDAPPPMSAAANDAASKFPANLDPTSSPLSSLSSSFSSLSSTTSSASASSLYALVWKCFNEHDVIQLRDVYKHQQSAKRLGQMESLLLLQQQHNDGGEGLIANSINRLYRTIGTGTGSADGENHHKLMARQRQPAMIIQESSKTPKTNTITVQQPPASNVEVNLKNYLERIPTKNDWKKNKSINHTLYKYLNKSESEFDTTQINLYLRQKRLHQKRSSSCHGSARNTRTTTSSSRVYEMPIDDLGKLPPLPPPIKKNHHQRHHQRSSSSTLAATVDQLNSEGSSLNSSDESCSSSGEFNDINFPSAAPTSPTTATPIVVKSVLKKTKSDDHHGDHYQTSGGGGSSPKNQHYFASSLAMLGDKLRSSWNNHGGHQQQQHHHKKNVTFSAYATIQVVDT